jgi:hypothetical protein
MEMRSFHLVFKLVMWENLNKHEKGASAMSKSIKPVLCFMVFILFASTLLAIDVPLKYVKYPTKIETSYPMGMARLTYMLTPPPGNWKFPTFISANPIYSLVKLGEEEKLLILDRQKKEDNYYNRIYFDTNSNRNMTDDPVIDGKVVTPPSRPQYDIIEFPVVDTKIKVRSKLLPFSFRPQFLGPLRAVYEGNLSEERLNKMIYLYLWTNCMLTGKFDLEGETYHVVLGDANCNGFFHEKFALRTLGTPLPGRMPVFSTGDIFVISKDKEIDVQNQQVCGNWLLIKNKLFDVNIDQAEKKMTLSPVTKNLVPVKLAMQTEFISLYTGGGKRFLMTYRPDKKIHIPRGRYQLYQYRVLKNDQQGDLWSLSARATTETTWITLDGRGEPELKFGEPYVVSAEVPENRLVNVQGSTAARTSVFLSFSMLGQGNEDISDLSHIKGTNTKIPLSKNEGLFHRPQEPTYTILTADGKTAAQGSFEYG